MQITPFSATPSCVSKKVVWNYSGVDPTDEHELTFEKNLISVDSKTGEIRIARLKPIGTFFLKIIGTLPDKSSLS